MISVEIKLAPEVLLFYTRIACTAGKTVEQVLADALFKLAGELSLQSLREEFNNR